MKTFKEFRALLIAESIKLRRTPVLWMSLGAPLFAVAVAFTASLTSGQKFYQVGVSPWTDFSAHILVGWALFVFPIYVCLQTALYSSLEHSNNGWSYLAMLPIAKHKLFFSKYFWAVLLVAISQVLLVVLTWAAGWILAILRPSYGFQDYPMTSMPAKACMWVFLSGLTVVSIQMMLSMLYRSFVIPTGVGLIFTLGGVIARSLAASIYWPYLWPILLLNNTPDDTQWKLSFGAAGVLGFLSISILSILYIIRRRSLTRRGL